MTTLSNRLPHRLICLLAYGLLIASATLVLKHSMKNADLQSRLAHTMSVEGKSDLAWAELLESLSLRLYKGASDRVVQHQQLQEAIKTHSTYTHFATISFFILLVGFLLYLLYWRKSLRPDQQDQFWRHLVLLAFLCLFVGLIAPMMQMTAYKSLPVLGEVVFKFEAKSIVSTVASLFQNGSFIIGLIIFLFSILTPALKLIIVGLNVFRVNKHLHDRAHDLIHHLGKWSMADVFVVAILLSIFALDAQGFTKAQQEVGLYFFTAYCVLSIWVTNAVLKEPD